jgi:NAD(P)-dependent dehydrogenase (short-subunit alcohol dehydrogenase family)
MAPPLSGKSALITGGAGGFGLSSAMLLARDGAAVTLMGRSADKLEAAAAAIENAHKAAKTAIYAGDATRDADMRAAVALAVARHGRLDIVVATVGGGSRGGLIAETSAGAFMDDVSYNLRPAYLAIHESLPSMPSGGAFVFISSTAAVMPFTGLAGYCAGKAALDHLVRVAANELGGRGFRFNAVRPGLTRTPGTAPLFANEAIVASFLPRIPLGRTGLPDEIAQAVRYLAGPEASWTTGQSFAVDGGNELRGAPPFG